MKAKIAFISKSGAIKVLRWKPDGPTLELLIDLEGGGSATVELSSSEVHQVASMIQHQPPAEPTPPRIA